MIVIGCIILCVLNIDDNILDSAIMSELLELLSSSSYDGYKPLKLIVDMSYRGYHKYTDLDVIIHHKEDKKFAPDDLKTKVEALNRRSAIEQSISHMKNDFKLGINYLHGELGYTTNPIFSATSSNLRKFATKYKKISRKLIKRNYTNTKAD
jgi:hypothetical protein